MTFQTAAIRENTQNQFDSLLETKFPTLEAIYKWRQTMWHKEGRLVVSLVFLTNKMKFCFFNNPDIELDALQRWGSTVYSQNAEYAYDDDIDWDAIEQLLENTFNLIHNRLGAF